MYEGRAIAEDQAGLSTTSSTITCHRQQRAGHSTLVDPGANLQGSVALSGTATDAGSGIAAWTVQYRTAGAGAWTDACTTRRARTPAAGPRRASPTRCTTCARSPATRRATRRRRPPGANRRVDNNGPTVSLTDPGAYLRGTVALAASATDPAGMQSVVFERKLSSGSSWTTICTDAATPFTCNFNTTGLNGTYDLRARAIDTLGHSSSSTVTARQIDNTAPTASAVDSGNGGSAAGRLEPGDWLRLTWSEPIAPASVLPGWDGSPLAIRTELQNVNGQDEMDFWTARARRT